MSVITYIGFGSFIGFITFIGLLESAGMGKIIWRNGEFTPNGLWKYIKSPFLQNILWKPILWRHNWIIMSGFGGCLGALYFYF